MTMSITENDLPSVKFENEIKHVINYSELESYVKNHTSDQEINIWIQNFKSKMGQYLTDSSKTSSFSYNKRCKDIDHLLNRIKDKLYSLTDNITKEFNWTNEIKFWRDDYFKRDIYLKCKEHDKYLEPELKGLYDFCEDDIFIKSKQNDIEMSFQCEKIIANMSTRKEKLKPNREMFKRKYQLTPIPDIPCNPEILESILLSYKCKFSDKRTLERGTIRSNVNNDDSVSLSRTPRAQSSTSYGDLPDEKQGLPAMPGEAELSSNSSSNTIALVSLPILGILVGSFLLYRYTPYGSKFLGYFRNKGDIPLNQDNETTDQILFNTSNLGDIYSENMQYNLSYQIT
ncbi:PIR protein [Plasmodium ovale]|uniref:PIR Superfamily Protein n=2 Tax=Plasmodium ovale TaxID=36330 RepID=A0A1A8WGK9_PLAOA|nr:PIR Superfamily Protein [Plasmodium ovale curtisi]SBT84741.1 PIR protein [Plasmodium ovale]